MARRFPRPWTVKHNDSTYWVEDAEGKQFYFCYYQDDLAGALGKGYVSRDEARRLTAQAAKLPELLTGAG